MSLNVRRCRNIGLFLFTVSYNHTLCGYRVSSINILISYSEVYKVHHTAIYPAVQWSTKLQRELIFKHDGDSNCESARDLVSRRDRRGWLYRCSLLKRIFILEIRRRKYLSARNLFYLHAICLFVTNFQFPVFCLFAELISNSRPTFLHNRGVHAQLEMLHSTFWWRARDVAL